MAEYIKREDILPQATSPNTDDVNAFIEAAKKLFKELPEDSPLRNYPDDFTWIYIMMAIYLMPHDAFERVLKSVWRTDNG